MLECNNFVLPNLDLLIKIRNILFSDLFGLCHQCKVLEYCLLYLTVIR